MIHSKWIPRRWLHYGSEKYTFIRWLGRDWRKRPFTGSLEQWLRK